MRNENLEEMDFGSRYSRNGSGDGKLRRYGKGRKRWAGKGKIENRGGADYAACLP